MAMRDKTEAAKTETMAEVTKAALARWTARQDEVRKNRESFAKGLSPETRARKKKAQDHLNDQATTSALSGDPMAGLAVVRAMELGSERVIDEINDIVSVEFFERGLEAALSVGRITGIFGGTGFLVGPGILLTNHHVFQTPMEAGAATFDLDAEENRYGQAKRMETFGLRPDLFWATSKELDFSFVAVEEVSIEGSPLAHYGWHPLNGVEGKIRLGDGVSIIQHPQGQPKKVALHNARLVQLSNEVDDSEFCFYTCDTERGSSGSPVFSTLWEVIALHHASVPALNGRGKVLTHAGGRGSLSVDEAVAQPGEVLWIANEGVRVSRVVAGLRDLKLEDPAHEPRRAALLDLWMKPDVAVRARPQGERRLESLARGRPVVLESNWPRALDDNLLEVPLTLTLRIGTPRPSGGG